MIKIIQVQKTSFICFILLFLSGCAQTYNFISIKENPIYYDSKIKGSLTKVMTCVSESIDENAYSITLGDKVGYRQEMRSIPGAKKSSIGLYHISGKFLLGLVEFEVQDNLTQVKMYAHNSDSEMCDYLFSKCVRDRFINAIKICEK